MGRIRQSEVRANVTERAKKNLEKYCIDHRVLSTSGKGTLPMSQGAALTYILMHLDLIPTPITEVIEGGLNNEIS